MNAREFQFPNAKEAYVNREKKNQLQYKGSRMDSFLLHFRFFFSEIVIH